MIQSREWPPKLPALKREELRRICYFQNSPQMNRLFDGEGERAEDELDLLFADDGFAYWPHHPLCESLENSKGVRFVNGANGMGKTAFATALGEHFRHKTLFGCKMPQMANLRQMERTLTDKLFDFVLLHPTLLSKLDKTQLLQLAQVLASRIPADRVIARLVRTNAKQPIGWLDSSSSNVNQRALKAIATKQLNALKKIVESLREKSDETIEWSLSFLECLSWLRFTQLRLVFDLGDALLPIELHERILENFEIWNPSKLQVFFFSSNTQIFEQVNSGIVATIRWDKTPAQDDLHEMLKWRYESIRRQLQYHGEFHEIISDETLNKLLEAANGNPRRLFRLWRTIIELDAVNGLHNPRSVGDAMAVLRL